MAGSKKTRAPGGGVKIDRRAIIAVLVAVVLCVVTWLLFTGPMRSKQHATSADLASAQSQLDRHTRELSALKSGGATQANRLLTKSRELDALLPASSDKVALVADVDSLARSSGVTLAQMNPGTTVNVTTTLRADVYNVKASGPAASVTAFLSTLTSRSPLMTIVKLNVVNGGTSTSTMPGAPAGTSTAGQSTATFTLYAWYQQSPVLGGAGQPAPAQQAPAQQGAPAQPNVQQSTTSGAAAASGPVSAAPIGEECPGTTPVKGNNSSSGEKIYHVPGGASYTLTKPEMCFRDAQAAQAAGYRAATR